MQQSTVDGLAVPSGDVIGLSTLPRLLTSIPLDLGVLSVSSLLSKNQLPRQFWVGAYMQVMHVQDIVANVALAGLCCYVQNEFEDLFANLGSAV